MRLSHQEPHHGTGLTDCDGGTAWLQGAGEVLQMLALFCVNDSDGMYVIEVTNRPIPTPKMPQPNFFKSEKSYEHEHDICTAIREQTDLYKLCNLFFKLLSQNRLQTVNYLSLLH